MASSPRPLDADWKNPQFLSAWKANRLKNIERVWQEKFHPLFMGVPLAARRDDSVKGVFAYAENALLIDGESLTDRARRLEEDGPRCQHTRRNVYAIHRAIGKTDAGDFVLAPWAQAANSVSTECAKHLYEIGLTNKAQRRIACGVLWAKRPCTGSVKHRWRVSYQCGNRYCQRCGPRRAYKLFAESLNKLSPIVDELKTNNRSAVVASIDFTWRNTGTMPDADEIRFFNQCIRKCFRILAKRFGFTRRDYGVLWCDEFGGRNTNLHAHGIYVGPWIPQTKRNKELSRAWAEATGGIATIASIKMRSDITSALAHALKYPTKYVVLSSPARLAELECAFDRVRRLHALARFYNAKAPENDQKLDFSSCPICKSPLAEIRSWVPFEQVKHLPDLEEFLLHQRGMNVDPQTEVGQIISEASATVRAGPP